MKSIFILFLCICLSIKGFSQDVPTPAPAQDKAILIKNATIHIGNGEVLMNANLLLDKGKITFIGTGEAPNSTGAEMIDATGKHLYPGLIAPNTILGLSEIEAARPTRDFIEVGEINPNARALIGYNTDSRVTPTIRSNGILLTQIAPQGGLIAGQSSIVQLDAWNWEDAAYSTDDGLHIYYPTLQSYETKDATKKQEQLKQIEDNIQRLQQAFADAESYRKMKEYGDLKAVDLRWESMISYLKGDKRVYLHADNCKQLQAALSWAKSYNLKIVVIGAKDAVNCLNLLKESKVSVVLTDVHSLPSRQDDAVDAPFRLPSQLQAAGIPFCLSMDGMWQQRNLSFQAGTAAAYGLSKEQALRAITLSPAEIMGISDRTGSLEVGKDANLLIVAGDILDMRTAKVEQAFIQGRKINLGNKQKDLYKKFEEKYGRKGE